MIGGSSDTAYVSGVKYTVNTHSFGYPAARSYDGASLISCWGGSVVAPLTENAMYGPIFGSTIEELYTLTSAGS